MTDLHVKNTIGIYVPSLNHFTETIAYWMALNPKNKVLIVTPKDSKRTEHDGSLKRLAKLQLTNIELVTPESYPTNTDWLYIKSSRTRPLFEKNLNAWIRKTERLGLLAYCNPQDNFKSVAKQLLYTFPYYLSAQLVLLQISSKEKHPYSFIRKQAFFSPSVHPQFIFDESYKQLIYNTYTLSEIQRNYKFTFLGNRQPLEREAVLRRVKASLYRATSPIIFDEYRQNVQIETKNTNVLWIEYGEKGLKRGLKPTEYVKALNETDFCICPLGWGGNWTHRVIEALVCGAIPILEDAERYNIGLTDMETCIAVKNDNWEEAIERASQLELQEVFAMRSKIKTIKENYLLPEVAAFRLRESLNLN